VKYVIPVETVDRLDRKRGHRAKASGVNETAPRPLAFALLIQILVGLTRYKPRNLGV
jgi:hypothetical protein